MSIAMITYSIISTPQVSNEWSLAIRIQVTLDLTLKSEPCSQMALSTCRMKCMDSGRRKH